MRDSIQSTEKITLRPVDEMTERRRVLLARDRVLLENLADAVEVFGRKLNVLGCPVLVEVFNRLGLQRVTNDQPSRK